MTYLNGSPTVLGATESRVDQSPPLTSNPAAAVSFLRRFHPASAWAISSFGPGDTEVGPACTFCPGEEQAAQQFIRKLSGKHNVYFSVNRVSGRLTKKARKKDIEEIHYLHVDADLSKSLNWSDPAAVAAEKARVLHKLRTYEHRPPTAIVWSGGGYQGFWRLSEAIVVSGDASLMLSAERRTQRIARDFCADACHNADRIMRLPGTINVLGPTKKGRRPALAELVEFHEDRIYDIEDFPEIEMKSTDDSFHSSGQPGSKSDDFARIRDALRFVPADDYDTYMRICMAVKSKLGDAGFGVCRDWAMGSVKFDEAEFRRKWRSFESEGGVTIGTLFGYARDHGWSEEGRTNAKVVGATGRSESIDNNCDAQVKPWPILESTAAHGLIGEIARLATRESEADPVAVMTTAHAWGAACFGRNRFYRVGDTVHHARLFTALVGASSRARKGTSLGPVQRIFRGAEGILQSRSTLPFPSGLPLNVSHGLSSGEGLIAEIRDKRNDEDEGVKDKRLLVAEGEFGAVLRQFQRVGNTLSTTLRTAWDGWDLGTMTKNNRDRATDPHICIIGHITRQELNELLSNADIWNGVANRFLWAAVRRTKMLPFAKPMPDDEVDAIGRELARVIEFAHGRSHSEAELTMTNSAQAHWADCYPELTQDHPGILGAVTSRAEAQTLRLAMNYALFDGATRIEIQHLEAALCFWRYCFDSASFIFKGAEIDPVAQKIIEGLAEGPKTQTEISRLFAGHLPRDRLTSVLADLQERGRITLTTVKTAGAPRRIWSLTA